MGDWGWTIVDKSVRPNPAELGFGTAVRIRPNSFWGRSSESGRTRIGDDRPNPTEKHIKHDRNQSFGLILDVLGSKFVFPPLCTWTKQRVGTHCQSARSLTTRARFEDQ